MTVYIGVVSQKGGVGKSTIARLIAREYMMNDWNVKIADLDISQGTSHSWHSRRLAAGLSPVVAVEKFGTVDAALKVSSLYDLMIFDGAPHSTQGTLRIAKVSNLLILPTGLARDDLEPTVLLAHSLVKEGINRNKITCALCRVGDSDAEIEEARQYIQTAGYTVLDGAMPEKLAYRRASDMGQAPTETRFPTLNQKADVLTQSIMDTFTKLMKEQAA
jgi:chromosome partitioning protein